MSAGVTLFGRQIGLYLFGSRDALDLSQFRIKFRTTANDLETLNSLYCRVYNVSAQTIQAALSEYKSVALNAGYEGQNGQIFKGTITRFAVGKESNIDSFLDIYASDGDILLDSNNLPAPGGYNFGVVNATLPTGSTPLQALGVLSNALGLPLDGNVANVLHAAAPFGGILPAPRGKVMWGMARDFIRDIANTVQCRWSIQNGKLTLIPNNGYLPGEAVVINSATGMIGVPEATQQGIAVRCLLNPIISVGRAIQLNSNDIVQTVIENPLLATFGNNPQSILYAQVAGGTSVNYRAIVIEHSGDTRQNDFVTDIVCLLINQGATPSVFPFGVPPTPQ